MQKLVPFWLLMFLLVQIGLDLNFQTFGALTDLFFRRLVRTTEKIVFEAEKKEKSD